MSIFGCQDNWLGVGVGVCMQFPNEFVRSDQVPTDRQTTWMPDSIHLVASRSDVEAGNTGEILRSLKDINSSMENALRFRGAVDIAVHGYNDDDRELYEIPEVRRYYELLTDQFPYFFFFLNLSLPTLKIIAFCLCDARKVGEETVQIDKLKLATFVQDQFVGLNTLFHKYDLDTDHPDLMREISDDIFRYFEL